MNNMNSLDYKSDLTPYKKDYIKQGNCEILSDLRLFLNLTKEQTELAEKVLLKYTDWGEEDMWR